MKDSLALSPRLAFLISALLSLMLGVVDWASGYELQFFVFYFIPITLAGWNCGLARTLAVSALCGGIWISIDVYSGHPYSNWFYTCWSAMIRIVSFLLNGYSVVRIKDLLLAKQQAAADLQQALAEAKTLKGLLPLCAICRRIRNEEGYLQQVEEYLSRHPDAFVSLGHCYECAAKALGDVDSPVDD